MISDVEIAELVDQLDVHGTAMADAAELAGLAAAVPTCPEWDVRALLAHTGMVHRWAAGIVRCERDATSNSEFPAPPDGVVDWFREGHGQLVEALRSAPADLDTWTFLRAPSPLAFWARRQAHETAIHRVDAEAAAGSTPTYESAFAMDGIAELLEGFYARPRGKLVADPGFTLQAAPDDSDVSWTIQVGPDGRVVTRHDSNDIVSADCTLRGAASDLYLDLWNRQRTGSTRIDGSPEPIATWRALATVSWS